MGLIVVSGSLLSVPTSANAFGFMGGTGGGFLSDPFNFYYAFYLPNQQMQSMRLEPSDTLNQVVAARQYYAQTDRRGSATPISRALATKLYDPLHPYSGQTQERRRPPVSIATDPSNADGQGPSLYYGRASAYFPGVRAGPPPNANAYGRTSHAADRIRSSLSR